MTPPPSEKLPRLFLIRHGDTNWTDTTQHTGLTDIPLNPVGEARALKLKERLAKETFARVFTSPLSRAKRTCELAGLGTQAEVNADLVEWDYGDYEGIRGTDIRAARPGWEIFRDGVPNGETPDDVAARADRFLALVRPLTGDIAAFSSGHFIRMLAARWLGLVPQSGRYFYSGTASVGILGYEHGREQPVVQLWNETVH